MEGKQIGALVLTAVALIVGLILLQASSQEVGKATNTITNTNYSINVTGVGVATELVGQEYIGNGVILNMTSKYPTSADVTLNETANATAFTWSEAVATSGVKKVFLTPNFYDWANQEVLVTYDYGAEGYIGDSGGRAIAGIIVVMFAIALAIVALYPTLKEAGYMGYR